MATTTVALTNPLFMKDVSLVIGPTATSYEFRAAIESVAFTPSTSIETWVGLGGVTLTDTPPETWVCDITFVQDWETANSLSQYLLANKGTTVDVVFKPKNAGAKTVTAKITLTPGPIGGGVGLAKATVSLGVQGVPVVA
jgi:hypothetical protein